MKQRMKDAAIDPVARGFWARAGIAALNLIVPGLGLIRMGKFLAGAICFLAIFVFALAFAIGLGKFPVVGYYSAVLALIVTFALLATLYIVPITITWSESKYRAPLRIFSRWYSIIIIGLLIVYLEQFLPAMMHHFYKGYYLPSESMSPTAEKNDKVVADMRWRGPLQRGQVIIFQGPDGVRISRVAAVEDDRIALRNGVPIVNGVPATQSIQGRASFKGPSGQTAVTILREQLPGETSPHRIFDAGPSDFDTMQEAVVPKGHFFVLGDNRDFSADSRVPLEFAGVGMPPLSAIIGRATRIYWSDDHAKIGARLDQ